MTLAVELRDLWLSFGGYPILEGVSLEVAEGDFLAIIGPNGGGKTVLLRTMLGLEQPDRGDVKIFGREPRVGRREVGYVPQHVRFDRKFPIDVLGVVQQGRLRRSRLFRPFTRDDRDRAMSALEEVSLTELARRPVGRLSGGQLQRVLIARALAVNARLLMLDEPAASLDPHMESELYELLGRLSADRTVILVTHDIGVLSRHIKRIACLNRQIFVHESKSLSSEMLEEVYGFPVDMVSHDHDHGDHDHDAEEEQ